MRRLISISLLRIALVAACVAPYGLVHAQAALEVAHPADVAPLADPSVQQKKEGGDARGRSQKIERIHTEDSNASIDELRVGGQTQRITVQHKSSAISYEVVPGNDVRTRQGNGGTGVGSQSQSRTVWNVLKF